MDLMTKYPNGFANGVAIRGVPILNTYAGNIWWVDSGIGSNGNNGKSAAKPFATIDYAIGRCTASNGDIILVSPGHAETVATAGAIACDVVGISIVGLGAGALRPTLTFSAVDATMTVSASSVTVENILIKPSIDSVVSPIVVSGSDCYLDVEVQDASATVECVNAILTTAAADLLTVNLVYRGFIAGNACVNAIRLVGCDKARINVDFYGVASTSIVEFHTTACHNIEISGTFYNSGTTNLSKNVVDTATTSTWSVSGFDAAAGAEFSGGSGNAIAAGDLSAIATSVAAILVDTGTTLDAALAVVDGYHDVPTKDATTDTVMRDVVGRKTDSAAAGAVTETESLMAYAKQNVTAGIDAAAALVVIDEFHDVPAKDNTLNVQINEVIGNKTDTTAAGAVTETDTLVGYIKQLVTAAIAEAAQTLKLDGVTIATAPTAASLATFLASGGTSLGTQLPASKSLYDMVRSYGEGYLVSKAYADLTGYTTLAAFTVTGDVMVKVIGVVGATGITSTSGTTTLSLGTTEAAAGIVAASTVDNTQFAATDVWVDSTPANDVELAASAAYNIIGGGADIILTGSVNDLTAGTLTLYCFWKPLSTDGAVVAA